MERLAMVATTITTAQSAAGSAPARRRDADHQQTYEQARAAARAAVEVFGQDDRGACGYQW